MLQPMATKDRVYTALDAQVIEALDVAAESGLVEPGASRSERLRALAVYAKDRLREQRDLDERIAAYDEIAGDQERAAAIEASVLAAVEDGLL